MNNSYSKLRKRNTSLIKLRKGDVKFSIKKPKEDTNEFSNNVYKEYINKKKLDSQNLISKRSVEILSSYHLNMYNGINNGETEKKNLIVKHMDDDDKEKNNNILINSTKFKLGNESKNNDIFLHDDNNDHLNKNNNANSDIEDINNKTNSYFPLNKIILVNNKKDKKHNLFLKSNKRKKRIYNLDSEKEDDDEVEDYEQFLNIKVFYEGKGLSLKVSKDDKFGNCLSKIQKMLFPFYKLSDYNILYKLKVLDTKSLHEEKIKNIIKENDSCVTFYLKKKLKIYQKIIKKLLFQ
jgi:hypothetical protein